MNKIDLGQLNTPFCGAETKKESGRHDVGYSDYAKVDAEITKNYENRVEELNELLALAENPADIGDETRRVVIFAKLSYGLRKAGEAVAWSTYYQKMAYVERKNAEAVAAMDEYQEYLASKKQDGKTERATNEMRNYYVHLSGNVMKANKKEALVNAIHEHLTTIRAQFLQAISTMRSMSYGIKDSSYMSGSAVNIYNRE